MLVKREESEKVRFQGKISSQLQSSGSVLNAFLCNIFFDNVCSVAVT